MTTVHESTHATRAEAWAAVFGSLEQLARDFGEVAADVREGAGGLWTATIGAVDRVFGRSHVDGNQLALQPRAP